MRNGISCLASIGALLMLFAGTSAARDMMVAEWAFDEGTGTHAGDESSHNHSGTLVSGSDPSGAGMWTDDGAGGKALKLNGIDEYVACGSDAELSLAGAFTIQGWVKPAADCPKDAALIGKLGQGYSGYDFLVSADYAGFRYGNSAGEIESISFGQRPGPGVWSFLAITKEGRTVRTYFNGAPDKTFTMKDASIAPNDRPLLIGFNQWNDRHYKGLIANVRIYNYARTAEDLLAEYRAASAR
ncbi:MAG: LamG domain-containing protein, partial [Planctomycetota bacterium]